MKTVLQRAPASLSVFLVLLSGCTKEAEVVDSPMPAPMQGEYSRLVKPIFDRNCGTSSCHGGGPNGFAGGLDLTSYDGLFRGSRYGTVVVPGLPYMSHLIQSINQTDTTLSPISSVSMPASRDPLASGEVQTIVRWVQNGARDDLGHLPFPEPRPAGKIFFSSQFVDLVGVLDGESNLIMRYTSVGTPLPLTAPVQAPHNVQVDDQGRFYYVTLISANRVKKYDAVTNQLLGEFTLGGASDPASPAHVVITADGQKGYVTDFNQNVTGRVYAFNTATMTITGVITAPGLMKRTHGARISHDGKYLYIGSNQNDLVTVVQTNNDSIVAHVKVAGPVPPLGSAVYLPYQIAVRGDDRYIYVTCNGKDSVGVIERTGDSFAFVKTIPVGNKPLQCEVTPDERFLYVCNRGSNSVTVIRTDSNTVYTTIQNVGKQPHGIDITADSRLAYVTCENVAGGDPPHHPIFGSLDPGYIAVIDIATNLVARRIEVGGFAAGVSVYPGKGN